MQYLLVIFFGAIANRLRGGGIIPEKYSFFGTQKRRLAYCFIALLVFVLARAEKIGLSPEGIPSYSITNEVLAQGIAVFVILFTMHLTGWGRAIGAVGGWEDKPLEEFEPLDIATNETLLRLDKMPMWNKGSDGSYSYYPTSRLRLWGLVWLTYWGLITGCLLGIVSNSFAPLICFSLIGVVYYVVFSSYIALGKKVGLGWPASEYVFGAVSFLGLLVW